MSFEATVGKVGKAKHDDRLEDEIPRMLAEFALTIPTTQTEA